MRDQQQQIRRKRQNGRVGVKREEERQKSRRDVAFPFAPEPFADRPREQAGEQRIHRSRDAQDRADRRPPQQVHRGNQRRLVEPGVAINHPAVLHL